LMWLDARAMFQTNSDINTTNTANTKVNFEQYFESFGVGLSDGGAFGADNGWLRLNFGCPRPVLREALTRIVQAVEAARAVN
jgi:bifunctional pyridoxal-dependent enzyme with beta-cystathionase and maltose regulon repressor activities